VPGHHATRREFFKAGIAIAGAVFVSPIWYNEKERDDAGEPSRV